jgi:hypothetical protein
MLQGSHPTTDSLTTRDYTTEQPSYIGECPSNVVCKHLGAECIDCDLDNHLDCVYGSMINVTCKVRPDIVCTVSWNWHMKVTPLCDLKVFPCTIQLHDVLEILYPCTNVYGG